MSQKNNIKLTGMFVLTAVFILIGTFLLMNRDNLSSHSLKYVLYFEDSVKGLSVGAPVVLNGIELQRDDNRVLSTKLESLTEVDMMRYILLHYGQNGKINRAGQMLKQT